MRIAIVAGEVSGDMLGASLIQALRERLPDVQFEGVAGPRMVAAGCRAMQPMEMLSVMGITEVLGRLPQLLAMRAQLARYWRDNPPDLFIGIDAPDFNLGLEYKLKRAGIKTVHYVSPSVWAWRDYRVKRIKRAVDLMLTLFPFEKAFYERHGVAVEFVGHPFADAIDLELDGEGARRALVLPAGKRLVALLPGSRMGEVSRLSRPFLETAEWLAQRLEDVHFVAPLATAATREFFRNEARNFPSLPLTIVEGRSREVMAACEVVLLASGTAALEALLLKKPMVVAYRLSGLTYLLVKRLLKVRYFSLPNLLADEALVPERVQDAVCAAELGPLTLAWLVDTTATAGVRARFEQIHRQLRLGGAGKAADAIVHLLT